MRKAAWAVFIPMENRLQLETQERVAEYGLLYFPEANTLQASGLDLKW